MNLQHLRYFVELAHTHNYALAAELLHVTQPSLTYAINQLEEELGVALFTKSGRSNVLTSYGEQFLVYADGALKTLDQGVEAINTQVHQETVIRVGFLRFLGIRYIPRLVNEFMEAHPDYRIRFEFETGSTKLLLDGINANRFDAVFCAPAKQVQKYGTYLGKQRLYLIVPLDHPLADREQVRMEETLPYSYVYYVKGTGIRNIIENSWPGISQRLRISCEIIEERVVAGFVAAGFGIGIIPEMALMTSLPIRKIEIVDPPIERDIFMIPTATREMTPALELFLKFMKRKAAQENETFVV